MAKAYSPQGTEIVAASELVPAHAHLVADSFGQAPDGSLTFDYAPSGSKMIWDGQYTSINGDGNRIFVDENGLLWDEDQIELRD